MDIGLQYKSLPIIQVFDQIVYRRTLYISMLLYIHLHNLVPFTKSLNLIIGWIIGDLSLLVNSYRTRPEHCCVVQVCAKQYG